MANPDGSRGGWPSIRRMAVVPLWRQEEGRASDPCQEEGHATSDWSPAPRHATLWSQGPASAVEELEAPMESTITSVQVSTSSTTWSATSEGIARRNYENEKNALKQ